MRSLDWRPARLLRSDGSEHLLDAAAVTLHPRRVPVLAEDRLENVLSIREYTSPYT